MPISPGARLGSYEVLSLLGAGGMGEVYKARDTRLERTVAIKVLPSHLADKPQLRERFEREARTVASLNHPHICTLYDIGQQDGIHFLVMEHLDGETPAIPCRAPLQAPKGIIIATIIPETSKPVRAVRTKLHRP